MYNKHIRFNKATRHKNLESEDLCMQPVGTIGVEMCEVRVRD